MDVIYQFSSTSRSDLGAFTRDRSASSLPQKYGPWSLVGTIDPYQRLPFKFSRETVEAEIKRQGFQLWRMREKRPA